MDIAIIVGIGLAFTAFAALVFALLTLLLDWMDLDSFSISGPTDWSFWDFYKRYLIIAAVYTFVSIPLNSGLLGIGALALAYKFVFDAGWPQAIIMGIIGGIIALVLFRLLLTLVLAPLAA